MKTIVKVKCIKCLHKIAKWEYSPSDFEYFCENCVPRGCVCNIDEETGTEARDEKGRLYPCCEFNYSENGWTANFLLNKGKCNTRWVNMFFHKSHFGYVLWKEVYKYYR